MSTTPNIHLDLRLGGSTDPGWTNVQASNNQTYGFRYTGGADGAGAIIATVGMGRDTARVQLTAAQHYRIESCRFTNDANNQLTWRGQSGRAGTIIDENTHVETARYSILVKDTGNGDCTVPCDPPVINRLA